MTNPERMFAFLRQKAPDPICDDCLATGAEVSPRQQVNPVAGAFGLTSDFTRGRDTCSMCQGNKLVTRYIRHA